MARVLLIDDDLATLKLTALHLSRAGHEVDEFTDSMIALAHALSAAPDLIVSDIHMPGLDGFGLLSALRAQSRTASIPLIFLTARNDHAQFRKAMRMGADDFLSKPVNPEELLEAVAGRLARVNLVNSAPLPILPLEVRAAFTSAHDAGHELGGYVIDSRLAAGGMSTVYLAHAKKGGAAVALKVIRLEADTPPDMLERFINEHELLERLRHPNIVPIYAQGFTDDCAYIAMEYFPRGSLGGLMRSPLAEDAVLWIVRQIAAGLEPAHRAGIVHRDLKPDNVMMRADGTLALTDFGIAKDLNAALGNTTDRGMVLGTPVYMAPEQALGQPAEASADIYSMGIMLYQMLTGVKPFEGTDHQRVIYLHINAPVPRLPSHLSHWQDLLDLMLAKLPPARPADATALLICLNEFG
jgi:eukaryotic-like serine/threonine-protein kinase